MKRLLAVLAIVVLVAGGYYWFMREQKAGPAEGAAAEQSQIIRGEYLARIGDCFACHTERGGQPYAGGLEMQTPFGSLYTTNITPDPETGIGKWSAEDFWRALHEGKSKDGSFLYPGMPFNNYTYVTRADSDAIYAYFMSLKPVKQKSRPHEMGFPRARWA